LLAAKDRKKAEDFILNWLSQNKEKYKGSTTRLNLAGVKSLCEFAELPVPLNWKKIIKASPKISKSDDRPPTLPEIRTIFDTGDDRLKFILSLMVSSGIRVGAFDYFKVKDYRIIEQEDPNISKFTENSSKVRIAELTVYRGEPEVYRTFASSENVEYFNRYVAERIRSGEQTINRKDGTNGLLPEAPLVVHPCSFVNKRLTPERSNVYAISIQLSYAWKRSGLETINEFHRAHGMRKFFKTSLESSGCKSVFIERWMGHMSMWSDRDIK
jgi:integrase